MNSEAEKLELINWISRLKDQQLIQEMFFLKKRAEIAKPVAPRELGGGKHSFSYIAADFNAPPDDFKEYME